MSDAVNQASLSSKGQHVLSGDRGTGRSRHHRCHVGPGLGPNCTEITEQLADLPLNGDDWHLDWNYVPHPRQGSFGRVRTILQRLTVGTLYPVGCAQGIYNAPIAALLAGRAGMVVSKLGHGPGGPASVVAVTVAPPASVI